MFTIYINGHVAYTGFETYEDAERFADRTLDIAPTDSVCIR